MGKLKKKQRKLINHINHGLGVGYRSYCSKLRSLGERCTHVTDSKPTSFPPLLQLFCAEVLAADSCSNSPLSPPSYGQCWGGWTLPTILGAVGGNPDR